ncbi:MAG: multicopper oxidase family protein, partial [Candidatus Krumholzibacteriia bacterium]
VSYTFNASEPGTYLYHSGTNPELQIEMGLTGAIVVRPVGFDPGADASRLAYNHPSTWYHHEYLFFLTEMDHRVHEQVEFGQMAQIDNTTWFPYYWFINGRNAPDTMSAAFSQDLPHQPYNCVPRAHPGERVLIRVVGAGRDMHPFHHHGNHSTLIARDGRLVAQDPGSGPDLATKYFTIPTWPGSTYDTIWDPWTGYGLGWDVMPNQPVQDWEDPRYTDIPLPVELPADLDLTFGAFYSGSPYLGSMGSLPPGNPGFNANGGYAFMWHSHNEKELTSNDIYPGGMFTMMIVEPPGVPIE